MRYQLPLYRRLFRLVGVPSQFSLVMLVIDAWIPTLVSTGSLVGRSRISILAPSTPRSSQRTPPHRYSYPTRPNKSNPLSVSVGPSGPSLTLFSYTTMPSSRGYRSTQPSMRSHTCQSIQPLMPIIPSQSFHNNRDGYYIQSLQKSRAAQPTQPKDPSHYSQIRKDRVVAILSDRSSRVISAILDFLFAQGSLPVLVSHAIEYSVPPRMGIIWIRHIPSGVQNGPVELETAEYQLSGIPYKVLLVIQPGGRPTGQPTTLKVRQPAA